MTESDWTSCFDPQPMLEFLAHAASDRKLRLFACACFRALHRPPTDGRCHRAVNVVEQYADGLASDTDLAEACGQAFRAYEEAGVGADPSTTVAYNVTRA